MKYKPGKSVGIIMFYFRRFPTKFLKVRTLAIYATLLVYSHISSMRVFKMDHLAICRQPSCRRRKRVRKPKMQDCLTSLAGEVSSIYFFSLTIKALPYTPWGLCPRSALDRLEDLHGPLNLTQSSPCLAMTQEKSPVLLSSPPKGYHASPSLALAGTSPSSVWATAT